MGILGCNGNIYGEEGRMKKLTNEDEVELTKFTGPKKYGSLTVAELMEELRNYPVDMQVWGIKERSDWGYDEETGSYEVTTVEDGQLGRVEQWTTKDGQEVVRLS